MAVLQSAQMGIGRTFQNLEYFRFNVLQNIEVAQSTTKGNGQKHEKFVQSAIMKFNLTDSQIRVETLHIAIFDVLRLFERLP